MAAPESTYFFSSPEDAATERRGDPLGLRREAERYAEILAPGITNRTFDARWVSILSWVLVRANEAWRAHGGQSADASALSRDDVRQLYEWMRPLELLWVARTVVATRDQGKGRQLPGVRAVRAWVDARGKSRFGLEANAYERYRSTGAYGAYRTVFRSLPGLTLNGNGWLPSGSAAALARVVSRHVREEPLRVGRRTRTPENFWQEQFRWERRRTDFIPTDLRRPVVLPENERTLLRAVLFGDANGQDLDAQRRRHVAAAAARSRAGTRSKALGEVATAPELRAVRGQLVDLDRFCALADAGVDAMNTCWAVLKQEDGKARGVSLTGMAKGASVHRALGNLVEASRAWRQRATPTAEADTLAGEILAAGDRASLVLEALLKHHEGFAGGRHWLGVAGGRVQPLTPTRGGAASRYRFRVAALCRMALQCGEIRRVPDAFRGAEAFDEDSE
jgi:hypothetical protein